jgi:replicative DNA helicase
VSIGLYDAAIRATKTFRTFEPGQPELIKLGIGPVDRLIGGVGPGTLVVIGLPTGVGKSSLALHMLLNGASRGGYCSLEDPEDLIGARILAEASGVSSLKIRRKDFDDLDLQRLRDGLLTLQQRDDEGVAPVFDVLIGKSMDKVGEAVTRQAQAGCKRSIFDYLQKMRNGGDDRRNDIGITLRQFQGFCYENNMVAIIMSQFTRLDPGTRPRIRHFKESGDIENEARIALVGWQDDKHANRVNFCLEKSTYGGAGMTFSMEYDDSGSLRECFEEDEEF